MKQGNKTKEKEMNRDPITGRFISKPAKVTKKTTKKAVTKKTAAKKQAKKTAKRR